MENGIQFNNGGEEAIAAAGGLAFMLLIFAISIAVMVVVCLILQTCFKSVPQEHRKMQPGMVWLLVIPLVGLVWNFFVFLRLPESYKSYFDSIGRTDIGDAGRTLGLWFAICAVVSVVPCVNIIAGPVALVLLIIFLTKAWQLKNEIVAGVSAPGGE